MSEFEGSYELSPGIVHVAYICKILYEITEVSWFMESRLRILKLEDMGKYTLNNDKSDFQ